MYDSTKTDSTLALQLSHPALSVPMDLRSSKVIGNDLEAKLEISIP